MVKFAEHIDQLLVDPLVDAGVLRYRQLVELSEPAKHGIDSGLSRRRQRLPRLDQFSGRIRGLLSHMRLACPSGLGRLGGRRSVSGGISLNGRDNLASSSCRSGITTGFGGMTSPARLSWLWRAQLIRRARRSRIVAGSGVVLHRAISSSCYGAQVPRTVRRRRRELIAAAYGVPDLVLRPCLERYRPARQAAAIGGLSRPPMSGFCIRDRE